MSIRRGMSIGRDRPRPSQRMPALSRARWPCPNTRFIVMSDKCNYSETFVESGELSGGEAPLIRTVRKIVWSVLPRYSFCHVQGHGHLDTVHGLGHVDKQRNDVCTKCSTRFGNYGTVIVLLMQTVCPSPIGPPCPGGTWRDCMKSMSALRTCAEPSR